MSGMDEVAGNLGAALSNGECAVDLVRSSSEDWLQLGVILAKQKKYEDAAAAFRHAFQLNAEDVWALQDLAQALKHLGRNDEAIHEYRHAVVIKPRFGMAWLGLGQIYDETGRETEAEDCYQQALRNRIDRAPELLALARFCEMRGWREAAATNFNASINLPPFHAI